ncbi:Cof-type HAD-IIB family hydrolase [Carnobacterium mobile]|uniref:Cof-type HAD-IIB family hydrolase n=1 Tax=Carnobacterium mobile TaxID=2750 RepID=UPI00299F8E45|nr:Cof-type HAD-IIB family hydrolase [Carnobacterium mobile]
MNKLRENKLLVTDLDGTFVFNSTAVTEEDLAAFNYLSQNIYTAVATGRSIKEITHIEMENDIKLDYRIGFNGALVTNQEGDILHDQPIPKEKLEKLFAFIKKKKLIFDALDGKERIGNFEHENPDSLWNMNLVCVEDPYSILEGKKIYKINLRPDKKITDQLYKELKENFSDLSIYKTGGSRIEITDEGISKGIALDFCKLNERTEILAVGDSENDISMFKAANVSYCLKHATNKVSKNATILIDRFADLQEMNLSLPNKMS